TPPIISPVMAVISSSSPFTRTTFSLSTYEVWIEVSLREHFSLTDPNLDTDLTIYGKGKYIGVIDVHAECVQRNTTLLDLLGTCDFRATETTRYLYLDTFSAHAES